MTEHPVHEAPRPEWHQTAFTVPPAHQADRIPDTLAYVVRPSPARAIGAGLGFGFAWSVLMSVAWWFRLDAPDAALATALTLVFGVVLFGGFMALFMTIGGPLMACDEHGVWLRSRKFPVRALWLPWEAVRGMRLKRWGGDRALCVEPFDSHAGRGGALTALEHAQSRLMVGTRLTMSTLIADRPTPELIAAIAHYSRGRIHVQR